MAIVCLGFQNIGRSQTYDESKWNCIWFHFNGRNTVCFTNSRIYSKESTGLLGIRFVSVHSHSGTIPRFVLFCFVFHLIHEKTLTTIVCLKDILLEPFRAFRVLSSLDCGSTAIIEMGLLNTSLFSFSWEETMDDDEQMQRETQRLEMKKNGKQEQPAECQVEE